MAKYSEDDYKKAKNADVRDYVPDLKRKGAKQYTDCPFCGKEKGLVYDKKHNGMHCFSCGEHISGPIGAVMTFQKVKEGAALDIICRDLGIESESEKRRRSISESKSRTERSFCSRQLQESGLTVEDVTAKVKIDGTEFFLPTFRRGSVDKNWNVKPDDDEMLIYYYDLWGNPATYTPKGAAAKPKPYVRVRWSNPSLHKTSDGREAKYMSPRGSSAKFYIPQYIRERFLSEEHIETLIVQEGEKKAEKACKHGIASIGIQGIFNIGNAESGLIQDLQYIVQKCTVKNVILLMDSDWNHLSKNLQIGERVDYRPNTFAKAVIKFKEYVQTLHNVGVSVDIFFGHINENEAGDKGIDDLLCHTLAGKEQQLAEEIDRVMHTHDGKGQFVDIHKVTSKTDNQIKDFWHLNDAGEFFEQHRAELIGLPNFRFGYLSYRVDDGKILLASNSTDHDFWTVEQNDKGRKSITFDNWEAVEFLSNNGYYRVHTSDLEVDQYKYIRIEDGVVYLTGPTEIRDFVFYYMLQVSKDPEVRREFARNLGNWLSVDKLERIRKVEDTFDNFEPNVQRMYYKNGQIEVTAAGIKYNDKILGTVWSDRIINRRFRRVPVISNIEFCRESGVFDIFESEDARACDFWTFIKNTSNFWCKPGCEVGPKSEKEYRQHIVNKITTIGYLLVDYKYKTEMKAVVAMDGQLGEVGQSNGRTGKSLIGDAISRMQDQTYVDMRNTKGDDDYIYSNVTLRTRNIFLDDVKVNFDFGKFFGAVSGDLAVNPKGKSRFIIKKDKSPKFYITTNHAMNTQDRSASDRISYMAFSNWYNDRHSPLDDFHRMFFDDWDDEQWNLFDNFMAECAMFYLKSLVNGWHREGRGAVPPPMRDIELRTQRQLMGEAFFQWAETYFDESGNKLNTRIARKEMYDAFHAAFPDAKFGVTAGGFKKKVVAYCKFKSYHFNPSKPNEDGVSFQAFRRDQPEAAFIGEPDKSGGVEYFSVFSTEFAEKQPF